MFMELLVSCGKECVQVMGSCAIHELCMVFAIGLSMTKYYLSMLSNTLVIVS